MKIYLMRNKETGEWRGQWDSGEIDDAYIFPEAMAELKPHLEWVEFVENTEFVYEKGKQNEQA